MRRPFGKLMDMINELDTSGLTLGHLASQLGEPIERVMDAIDANKERAGIKSYISISDIDEPEHGL